MNSTNTAAVMNDIRDIKPPLVVFDGWYWFWLVAALLAVLGAVFLVWYWRQRRKASRPLPPPIPAHVRARRKLKDALALISQPKPFVIAVSDAVRAYLEERFNFRAPERTTEEFLRELSASHLLAPAQKESLGRFLASCDLVKFARYEPGENELTQLHASALRLVEETTPQAQPALIANEPGVPPQP